MTKRKLDRTYYVEEKTVGRAMARYYAYYINGVLPSGEVVVTLFDISDTREKAEEAIEQHKCGAHPTQQASGK
jgi:hypothetical protein